MKPERSFQAARPLAHHCPELLRRPPAAGELAPGLARLGERLARAYAAGLARLAGGDAPRVVAGTPSEATMAQIASGIAPLAGNSLLAAGSGAAPFLASLEAEVVLRLLDRAFGGKGQAPAELPDEFPMSAELFVQRLETALGDAFARATGDNAALGVRPLRRDGSLAALAPFTADQPLCVIVLDVEEPGGETWHLTLAFPPETLHLLLDDAAAARTQPAPVRAPADPAQEPYADVPLTISAVVVDMKIGFSRVASLRPGDIIPVAVARKVPLRIEGRTIAHGTAGAMDDRVAVQITQAF